ncbi:hypothetical protein [Clostridium algidicarnis]|uniref:hypothetical protein n=1 Tax=Clostridium algidicarnis TaxID=37659 RepID=UPI003FD6FEFA
MIIHKKSKKTLYFIIITLSLVILISLPFAINTYNKHKSAKVDAQIKKVEKLSAQIEYMEHVSVYSDEIGALLLDCKKQLNEFKTENNNWKNDMESKRVNAMISISYYNYKLIVPLEYVDVDAMIKNANKKYTDGLNYSTQSIKSNSISMRKKANESFVESDKVFNEALVKLANMNDLN